MLYLFFLAGISFIVGKAQDHEIVYPRMIVSRSGEKRVLFRAFNRDFHLKLEPIETISDDLVLVKRNEKGEDVFFKPNAEYLRQTILQDPIVGSTIHVDDSGPLKIKGIINEGLRIEPDPSHHKKGYGGKKGSNGGGYYGGHYGRIYDDFSEGTEQEREESTEEVPHKVFKVTARLRDSAYFEDGVYPPGVKGANTTNTTATVTRSGQMQVEIAIVSDVQHSLKFTEEECIIYHLVLLNCVNLRFRTMKESDVVFVLVIVKMNVRSSDQPYIVKNTVSGHALSEETLRDFCLYISKDALLSTADICHLVTSQPLGDIEPGSNQIDPGVIGIAYVGGVCDRYYKCGISEDDGNTFSGCCTFAHECGHSLGCPHDGESPMSYIPGNPGTLACPWKDGWIMSYDHYDEKQFAFSWCCDKCVKQLGTLQSAGCMYYKNVNKPITKKDSRLPGKYMTDKYGFSNVYSEAYYDIRCKIMRSDWTVYKLNQGKCLDGFSCVTKRDSRYIYYQNFDCSAGEPCDAGKVCKNGYCVPV